MSCVQLLEFMAMFFLAIHTQLPDCEKKVWRVENKEQLGLLCCEKTAYLFQGSKVTSKVSFENHCPPAPKNVEVRERGSNNVAAPIVFACGASIFVIAIV